MPMSVWVAGLSTAPTFLRPPRSREWRRICGRCWRQSSQIPRNGSLGCLCCRQRNAGKFSIDWNRHRTALRPPRTLFPNASPGRPSARRTPWRCPLGRVRLSYRELARRSFGHRRPACREGVGPDVVVILLAERGIDFLAAMIAVQRAGGAFLPLDPTIPAARLAQIIQHSRARAGAGRARLHRGASRGAIWVAGAKSARKS